jgi:hypothetical protein
MDRPDLLEYLFTEYRKKIDKDELELTEEAEAMFKSFVEFCRFQLKINPAIAMCSLEQGLGLKLADHNEIPLVDLPRLGMGFSGSMPVTTPPMHAAASGISGVSSVPIFGGDQR